jgi:hypothetical protein
MIVMTGRLCKQGLRQTVRTRLTGAYYWLTPSGWPPSSKSLESAKFDGQYY